MEAYLHALSEINPITSNDLHALYMSPSLIVIHTNTYFTGMFPLAKYLDKHSEFEPVFLFASEYPTLPNDIESCQKASIPTLFGRDVKYQPILDSINNTVDLPVKRFTMSLNMLNGFIRRTNNFLRQIPSRFFARTVLWEFYQLSDQIRTFRKLIRNSQIALLILPADNRYDLATYIKAAHLENIGVVVVPQFMAGPLEWAEYVWDQPAYQVKGFFNRLASVLFPRWRLDHKGRGLLALPGADAIAREWLGIAPPLPWVLHSGASDVIALESEAVKEYCLKEGLPSHQLAVTGSIAQDILFTMLTEKERRKSDMLRKLGFDNDLPIILSALPPDSLYMGRPECDFHSYHELIEFWCKSIAGIKGYNHIVVLHPSLEYDELKHIESFGLKLARDSTASVIPLCDIFVASISSTIQWAIACGIPVINYDVYRYRYTDYVGISGVLTTEEKSGFIEILSQLANDPSRYTEIAASQKLEAMKWGRLDGKAGSRLQELFLSVISKYIREIRYE